MTNILKSIDNYNNEIVKVIEETNKVLSNIPALSRYKEAITQPLKVIDKEKMNYIVEKSQEINSKIYNFSKSNTQTTRKLMSLTMLNTADSTYMVLKQILAQIERKQSALTENIFKLKEEQLELKELEIKLKKLYRDLDNLSDEYDGYDDLKNVNNEYEKELIKINIEKLKNKMSKIQINISNSFSYIEATIKEIGYLIESYEQIKRNKNISDDWSELDVEKEQVKDLIKGAFRNCIRDFLVHGRIGMGTSEWFEQLGISPFEAITEVTQLINKYNVKINNNDNIDYNEFYDFLSEMAEKYKDCYKKALDKIGLDKLISDRFVLKQLDTKTERE